MDDTPQAAVAQMRQAKAKQKQKQAKPKQAKQGLTLESKSQEELDAERAKAKQDAAIKKRAERPIKGGAGEIGQQQFDLGDTNGDLFNPVVPNEGKEKRGGGGAVSFDSPEMQKRDEQIRREYDAVVAAHTNADGTKKPTWMKAPNGEKTKLTERQWVQTRTPSFKAWFGDWETFAEISSQRQRIQSWVSSDNIKWARGKTRAEIFAHFGNKLEPIAYIPQQYLGYLSDGINDNRVYCGKGYMIDHAVNHHQEVKPEAYSNIQNIIDTPDDVKLDDHNPNRNKSILFIKNLENGGVVIVSFDETENGKLVLHKSFFDKMKVGRFKNLPTIKLSSEVGNPSISHTTKVEPGGHLPALENANIIPYFFAKIKGENCSKVVDENGEPLQVYHSTLARDEKEIWNGGEYQGTIRKPFTIFKRSIDGYRNNGNYFTSDSDNAGGYGDYKYTTFLNLQNPLVIDCKGMDFAHISFKGERKSTDEWSDWAEKNGYDGVIFRNVKDGIDLSYYEHPVDEYVAFRPNQIKSATDNIGSFDSSSDNINFDSPELSRPKDEYDYESMQRFKTALRRTLNQIDWDTPEMGRKAKDEVRATLRKSRPDLDERGIEDVVNEIAKFENTKEHRAAAWWLSKGTIRLPQDMLKVKQAIEIGEASRARVEGMKKVIAGHEATIKAAEENLAAQTEEQKIERAQMRLENAEERYQEASDLVPQSEGVGYEPFNYDSPMEMMDALHKFKPRGKPINPDTVPYLSDKRDMGHGVTTYLVDESRESQQAMREIINTHWGEDANPWCLLQGDGHGN